MFTLPHLFYIGFYLKWVSLDRWHLVVALAIQFLTNNQPMAFSPVCLFSLFQFIILLFTFYCCCLWNGSCILCSLDVCINRSGKMHFCKKSKSAIQIELKRTMMIKWKRARSIQTKKENENQRKSKFNWMKLLILCWCQNQLDCRYRAKCAKYLSLALYCYCLASSGWAICERSSQKWNKSSLCI